MPHRQMLRYSKGAALVLLACLVGSVVGEVGDFSPCLRFFYNETPPAGTVDAGPYESICQRYKNQYRFASLYDRERRTPLYSAYLLTPPVGKRPSNNWMYEPQLVFSRANPEMQPFESHISQNIIESQAVSLDYTNSTFTRGHLNPSLHHQDKEDRKATFTLTNIVPQKEGSNGGPWALLEREVTARLKNLCHVPAYVITGALPYVSEQKWIKNRVAVPEYMWSAYCCPTYNTSLPKSERPFFPTYAAVGRNDRESDEGIVPVNPRGKGRAKGYDVRRMPLETLEVILKQRLNIPISLFQGQCQ